MSMVSMSAQKSVPTSALVQALEGLKYRQHNRAISVLVEVINKDISRVFRGRGFSADAKYVRQDQPDLQQEVLMKLTTQVDRGYKIPAKNDPYADAKIRAYIKLIIRSVLTDQGPRLTGQTRKRYKLTMVNLMDFLSGVSLLTQTRNNLLVLACQNVTKYEQAFKQALNQCLSGEPNAFILHEKLMEISCVNPGIKIMALSEHVKNNLGDDASNLRQVLDAINLEQINRMLQKKLKWRNWQIWKAAHIAEMPQTEIASRFGLSDGRISQIIKEVNCLVQKELGSSDWL